MNVEETKLGGLDALACHNDVLQLTLLPELGAKVAALVDLATGRSVLTRPTEREYRLASLDDDYSSYDRSGWDECFPSVSAGFHPAYPWRGTPLADHGELWSRPWSWFIDDGWLGTSISGARFPYRFERRLRLRDNTVEVEYSVANLSEYPFSCLWSMHPLFETSPGMRIALPLPVSAVADYCTDRGQFPTFGRVAWPSGQHAGSATRDLSVLQRDDPFAIKLFADRLPRGRAAIQDPAFDTWTGVAFDLDEVPYLGIWVNESGWPASDTDLFHVALEPTIGRADDLSTALRFDEDLRLEPDGVRAWRVVIVVGRGSDSLAAFLEGCSTTDAHEGATAASPNPDNPPSPVGIS